VQEAKNQVQLGLSKHDEVAKPFIQNTKPITPKLFYNFKVSERKIKINSFWFFFCHLNLGDEGCFGSLAKPLTISNLNPKNRKRIAIFKVQTNTTSF
jgi:hypothetical protein